MMTPKRVCASVVGAAVIVFPDQDTRSRDVQGRRPSWTTHAPRPGVIGPRISVTPRAVSQPPESFIGVQVRPSYETDRPLVARSKATTVPSAPAPTTASIENNVGGSGTACQVSPSVDSQSVLTPMARHPVGVAQTAVARSLGPRPNGSDRDHVRPSRDNQATGRKNPPLAQKVASYKCSSPTTTNSRPFVAIARATASFTFSSPGGPQPGQFFTWFPRTVVAECVPSTEKRTFVASPIALTVRTA